MKQKLIDRVNQMSDGDIVDFSENKVLEMLELLEDLAEGESTGLIIKGPPGIGKSFTARNYLKQLGVRHTDYLMSDWEKDEDTGDWYCTNLVEGDGPVVRKSDSREWSVFADLFANREQGKVVMLDDNDAIMKDVTALSILMAATEHEDYREVDFTRANFNNELRRYGVPPKFEYNGSLVILTNFDMEGEVQKWADGVYKGKKPAHITRWEALLDRCDYIDMELDHPRVVRVYLENLIRKKGLYTQSLGFRAERLLTDVEIVSMFEWIRKYQMNFKLPLTFRTTNDICKLMAKYDNWQDRAVRKLCKGL
jgi:hypothetical protein